MGQKDGTGWDVLDVHLLSSNQSIYDMWVSLLVRSSKNV